MHVCPMVTGVVPHVGGPILPPCEPTVLIGYLPAARITDMATCVGPPDVIIMGSPTVLIGSLMAARIGDPTAHGGVIVLGCFTVIIGEAGVPSPSAPSAPLLPSVAVPAAPAAPPPPPAATAPVTAADQALAASSEKSDQARAAREKVVNDFYRNGEGLGEDRAAQAIKGINLDEPVKVVNFPPPPAMQQYVRKGKGPGNWFDPVGGQSGNSLGLNTDPAFRESKTFKTPKGKGLLSTAAPIKDDWTDPSHPVDCKGGGKQMVVDEPTRKLFKE